MNDYDEMDKKAQPGTAAQETPWKRMLTQEATLDRALTAIRGDTPESMQARTYIIAQIEALRWARQLYEV